MRFKTDRLCTSIHLLAGKRGKRKVKGRFACYGSNNFSAPWVLRRMSMYDDIFTKIVSAAQHRA